MLVEGLPAVDREQVLDALRANEPELKAAGVLSLSIFGSTARGEDHPADVDIAVRLADGFSNGGFDYFYRLEQLKKAALCAALLYRGRCAGARAQAAFPT